MNQLIENNKKHLIPKVWLHMGTKELKKEIFRTPKNMMEFNKPNGGLWASPYEDKDGYASDWHKESNAMEIKYTEKGVLFTVNKKARIYVIDEHQDLIKLVDKYKQKSIFDNIPMKFGFKKQIDFEKVSKDYDIIYLTERGQWETRIPMNNYEYDLYGWDCASCIILDFDVINKQMPIKLG